MTHFLLIIYHDGFTFSRFPDKQFSNFIVQDIMTISEL